MNASKAGTIRLDKETNLISNIEANVNKTIRRILKIEINEITWYSTRSRKGEVRKSCRNECAKPNQNIKFGINRKKHSCKQWLRRGTVESQMSESVYIKKTNVD